MGHRLFARTFAGLATALLMFGAVQAKGGGTSHFGPTKSHNTIAPIGIAESAHNFDVAGIESNDAYGSDVNEVFNLDVGANAWVTGIGWDVTILALDPSWLSKMRVAFDDSTQSAVVFLTVGVGDGFPGLGVYSSGGIVDLVCPGCSSRSAPMESSAWNSSGVSTTSRGRGTESGRVWRCRSR